MKNLSYLNVYNNSLVGDVPPGIGKLSNLQWLDLAYNSLQGVISEAHFANLSKLEASLLSSNSLIIGVDQNWIPPFQLSILALDSCQFLHPQFPAWLRSQMQLRELSLSNTSIADTIPEWFCNLPFFHVDLSHNQIRGKLPMSLQFTNLEDLILRSNRLEDPIPSLPNSLEFLDLSNNSLSGEFPQCWKNSSLLVLDLSNNNLAGEIPSSIGSLSSLTLLHLNNNNFYEELPLELKHCNNLLFLDLSSNKFTGEIPAWIGENLQDLVILQLRSNMFTGEIPSELCDAFSATSGLRINFAKSRIIPVNLEEQQAATIASLFGCSIEGFPLPYLGLPLSPKSLCKGDFLPLIEKIGNRLAGWKGRLLSRAGRLVLINSVLTSVPSYFCSTFKLPAWAIKEIDRMRRGFFWKGEARVSGFHCLVNWDQVCRPKRAGGLGVRNLTAANSALLMKGLWKFYTAKNLPWVQLLHRLHYRRRLPCGGGTLPSKCAPLWKGILSTASPFHASVSIALGDGATTPFWHTRWSGDSTLCARFPTLFALSSLRHTSVQRWMQVFAPKINFGFTNLRATDAIANRELCELSNVIGSTVLGANPDEMLWRWNKQATFSTLSAYNFLAFDGVDDGKIPHLWSFKIPLRITIFLWLAARDRLLTADRLIKRGWQGPSICVGCGSDAEDLNHLLFNCGFARNVWSQTFQDNYLLLFSLLHEPGNLHTRWQRALLLSNRSNQDHLNAQIAATYWELWRERNHRIFDNQISSAEACGRNIANTVALWRATSKGRIHGTASRPD